MNVPHHRLHTLSMTLAATALALSLAACGGGSDDAAPTGDALPNLLVTDSSSYFPLDKVKPDGSFFEAGDAAFGPVNPAFREGSVSESRWAIDTSAKAPDEATFLTYSMRIEAVTASAEAVQSLTKNLNIDPGSGRITQRCNGFPSCYDNTSAGEEVFRIVTVASVVDGKAQLERSFELRVRGTN